MSFNILEYHRNPILYPDQQYNTMETMMHRRDFYSSHPAR
jgi:hypothetical protein